jgi:hypothetical protein
MQEGLPEKGGVFRGVGRFFFGLSGKREPDFFGMVTAGVRVFQEREKKKRSASVLI